MMVHYQQNIRPDHCIQESIGHTTQRVILASEPHPYPVDLSPSLPTTSVGRRGHEFFHAAGGSVKPFGLN